MFFLEAGQFKAPLNFIIYRREEVGYSSRTNQSLIAASLFERSLISLKGLTANIHQYGNTYCHIGEGKGFSLSGGSDFKIATYYSRVANGYETVNNALVIQEGQLKKTLFVKKGGSVFQSFYSYIMRAFTLPVMEKWMPYIYAKALEERKLFKDIFVEYLVDEEIELNGEKIHLSELEGYSVCYLNEDDVESWIKEGLERKVISITDTYKTIPELQFVNMDSYFELYGSSIVNNLKREVNPLMPLKGGVEELLLGGNKRLWKQQGAVVNGIANALRTHNSIILNEGMGSGKTLQAISAVETYFIQKWLRKNPGKTLKDAYTSEGVVNYRVIVMPPGHLVRKWKQEIEENVPFAKATIIETLADLTAIKAKGIERDGKEFFVIGKDLCKLSCGTKPAPYMIKSRYPVGFKCSNPDCNRTVSLKGYNDMEGDCKCGAAKKDFKRISLDNYAKIKGLACPSCGEVIVNSQNGPLGPQDFAEPNNTNARCLCCGASLWIPNVKNIGSSTAKEKKWYKISHYSNAKLKQRSTAWVLKGHENAYKLTLTEPVINAGFEVSKEMLARKWAPSHYIKNQLKGFFDVAVFDELHVYKGGNTAQGIAMHALTKASKKSLGLTGTIAGGMANHLFYTLWRLAPKDMRRNGFKYSDETLFVERYGTLETEYKAQTSWRHNKMSKGNQIKPPTVKPGISPTIFQDFLVDKTVFLDLSDMSKHLPPLHEQVVKCEMSRELEKEYNFTLSKLVSGCKDYPGLGAGMLQFSLAYPDHPFETGPIIDPTSGNVITVPASLSKDTLYPKEKKLIEIVNQELSENRNCFVYAEYTADEAWKVTERVEKLLINYCGLEEGEVQILESDTPTAAKREQWIHKKASEGVKVFICNPRVVETGLDFIFTEGGKTYNYPTIIFYQMGMNLFTLWQASRRAFRLNQTEECRTFYLCYEDTNQAKMVRLMAEKQIATAAIQGHFSMEGLAAMSSGTDPRIVLLNNLTKAGGDDDKDDASEAERIFTSLNEATGIDESIYGPSETLLYREVFGESEDNETDLTTEDSISMYDDVAAFEAPNEISAEDENGQEEESDTSNDNDLFSDFFGMFDVFEDRASSTEPAKEPVKARRRKSVDEKQIDLFALFEEDGQ